MNVAEVGNFSLRGVPPHPTCCLVTRRSMGGGADRSTLSARRARYRDGPAARPGRLDRQADRKGDGTAELLISEYWINRSVLSAFPSTEPARHR